MSAPDPCSLRAPELIEFLHGGISVILGNAAATIPAVTRAFAPRVSSDGASVDVFVAPAQSAAVVANLSIGSVLAFTMSSPTDYRAMQIKRTVVVWGLADDADAAWLDRYWSLFQAACQRTGVTPEISGRLRCRRNLLRVTVTPRALFRQTPGPGAGAPLGDLSTWK